MSPAEASAGGRAAVSTWKMVSDDLLAWMRERDYRGWDPFDFLASPLVRALTLGSRWLGVAWTQLGRRSPVNLRPLLGVPRLRNPKALALVVTGLARRGEGREEAERLVTALLDAQTPAGGWGYPFPWANRDFRVPAGTPSSVVTAFVGHALLDAAERWPEGVAVEEALSRATAFLVEDLNRISGPDRTFLFSYTPRDRRAVHNASALAASLLARAGRRLGEDGPLETARRAARCTARAQRPDGSWSYGTAARDGWTDSYHTGYLLRALDEVRRHAGPGAGRSGTDELAGAVDRGLTFWRTAFFDGPATGLRPHRPYPVDMHAVADAIVTALHFRDRLDDGLALADDLASWSTAHMRGRDGRFHYRRHRLWTNRIPYLRWVQAWSFRAFSELAAVRAGDGG